MKMGMILNKDATEAFLEPESVDLFISHPPYFNANAKEYGNASKQMQNTEDFLEFARNIGQVVKHMFSALKKTGRILLILPNDGIKLAVYDAIRDIPGILFDREYIWDYSNSPNVPPAVGNEYCFILNIVKDSPYIGDYSIKKYIFDVPWIPSENLESYRPIGHTNDALPEALCSELIQKFSKEGDVVGDILGGTGTVSIVAKKLNRDFVYNDVSTSQKRIMQARLSSLEGNDVNKEQVVKLMTDYINHMNNERAIDAGMTSEQIKQAIESARPELEYVNGLMYDMLKEYGVINDVR